MAQASWMREGEGMAFPTRVKYLIIGAGVHGLSTAYHLAAALSARGLGSGGDILVVDKSGIAAGPSGIACGVIRNNYFPPPIRHPMPASLPPRRTAPTAS